MFSEQETGRGEGVIRRKMCVFDSFLIVPLSLSIFKRGRHLYIKLGGHARLSVFCASTRSVLEETLRNTLARQSFIQHGSTAWDQKGR